MTQATIQRKISHGYRIAAAKLGAPFEQFRPADPLLAALDPGNRIATRTAGWDVDYRFSHRAPGGYNHPLYFALLDLDDLRIGDYFSDTIRTFFIANIEPLRPPLAVACNRVVSLYQPSPAAIGPEFYSGNVSGLGTGQLTQWPASVLLGPKGEQNVSGLPADARSSWYVVLLPPCLNVVIKTGDVLLDDLARRYTISAAELTAMGFRCTAQYGGT